nr:hypothetical protein [Ciceribacter sp. RN22]
MDGHHRLAAARAIGLDLVPVIRLGYDDPAVHLSAWRYGEAYEPEDILRVAASGNLLPIKSTRHVIDVALPFCRVPLEDLRGIASEGAVIRPSAPHPSRVQLLAEYYHDFGRRAGIRTLSAEKVGFETEVNHVPHPTLRRLLLEDPAMAALMPALDAKIALGAMEDSPFRIQPSELLKITPVFLDNAAAASICVRWGLEALQARRDGALDGDRLRDILAYGRDLLSKTGAATCKLILDTLPQSVARALDGECAPFGSDLVAWMADLAGLPPSAATVSDGAMHHGELAFPLEHVLCGGGDSRLALDPATGFNRYGVPPRPRPEAVHFSSSTASAISDYGFLYCELFRRDLISAVSRGADPSMLRRKASLAVAASIARMVQLAPEVGDVVIAPSGTDVELLSVAVSLAADSEAPLTNILISPEETGRGVTYAGAGQYFDDLSATGHPVRKGNVVWPSARIELHEIAIRDESARPRSIEAIDAEFLAAGRQALDRGHRVLAHVLASSKTSLSAPSPAAVDALVALDPDRVDIVVDACQMRGIFGDFGWMAQRGLMVQITGSKFLTGPPFSGALLLPASMRDRALVVAQMLKEAPGAGSLVEWPTTWFGPEADDDSVTSWGPLFRWLPALLEAELLEKLPPASRERAFVSFRSAILSRMQKSAYLRSFRFEEEDGGGQEIDLARLSIVAFRVFAAKKEGGVEPLDEKSCRHLFELLNVDVSDRLGPLSEGEGVIARLQAHIGQPVALSATEGDVAVLRLVLGARFFNIVGHAGPGSFEAALVSEISDALRAIEKVELLASKWWRLT